MTVTALAERYRDLGFRVIEGGKSEKLIVVDSVSLADNFRKRHDHVLRDIKTFIEQCTALTPDLGSVLSIHAQPSTYRDSTGRQLPCFDLTEVGFTAIALGYDAALRFRYVLAFEELKSELGLRAQSIVRPVVERLQEIRGDWTQSDLFARQQPDTRTADQRFQDAIAADGPRGANAWFNPNAHDDSDDDRVCPTPQTKRPGNLSWLHDLDGKQFEAILTYKKNGNPSILAIYPFDVYAYEFMTRCFWLSVTIVIDQSVPWDVIQAAMQSTPGLTVTDIATMKQNWLG